jgi:hypothetical protein
VGRKQPVFGQGGRSAIGCVLNAREVSREQTARGMSCHQEKTTQVATNVVELQINLFLLSSFMCLPFLWKMPFKIN